MFLRGEMVEHRRGHQSRFAERTYSLIVFVEQGRLVVLVFQQHVLEKAFTWFKFLNLSIFPEAEEAWGSAVPGGPND